MNSNQTSSLSTPQDQIRSAQQARLDREARLGPPCLAKLCALGQISHAISEIQFVSTSLPKESAENMIAFEATLKYTSLIDGEPEVENIGWEDRSLVSKFRLVELLYKEGKVLDSGQMLEFIGWCERVHDRMRVELMEGCGKRIEAIFEVIGREKERAKNL